MQILTYLRIHYNSPKQLRNNDNANGGNGTEQIPTVSEPVLLCAAGVRTA